MMLHRMRIGVVLCAFNGALLAACSTTPTPVWQIDPPRAALMRSPEPLPEVREGDDLIQSHASLRAQYAREATKASSLQRYVRIILKKQKGSP